MTILQTENYPYKIYITEYPATGKNYGKLFVWYDFDGYVKYLENYSVFWGDFFLAKHHLFDSKEQAIKLLKLIYPDIEEFPRSHPDRHKLKGIW